MNPIFGELYHYIVRSKENDDELYHYGIKGMEWGERRFQNEDGSLTNAGRQRFYAKRNARNKAKKSKTATKLMSTQTEFKDPVKKGKKKKITDEEKQINAAAESMRQQTEDLRKHSAVNEKYYSAIKTHMRDDANIEEYRRKAIEDYINTHLSSYDGDRQKMIDKMGDIDDYAMKYYMKDHKDDYHVKGYHATIGNKRTAEREYTKRLKEVSCPLEEARKEREEREGIKEEKKLKKMTARQRKKYNTNKINKLIGKKNESIYDKVSRAAKSRWS